MSLQSYNIFENRVRSREAAALYAGLNVTEALGIDDAIRHDENANLAALNPSAYLKGRQRQISSIQKAVNKTYTDTFKTLVTTARDPTDPSTIVDASTTNQYTGKDFTGKVTYDESTGKRALAAPAANFEWVYSIPRARELAAVAARAQYQAMVVALDEAMPAKITSTAIQGAVRAADAELHKVGGMRPAK